MKHPLKINIDKGTAWRIFVDVCNVLTCLFIFIAGIVVLFAINR